MRTFTAIIASLLAAVPAGAEEAPTASEAAARHAGGAETTAEHQDELSADVQQLIIEQTAPEVIQLLKEAEGIMNETTDRLLARETGGETIAAQTEIIEKIEQAARQKSGGGGGMMGMLERMTGKAGEETKEGGNGKDGDQAGKGRGGASDAGSPGDPVKGGGAAEERRVPKAAGTAGTAMPEEFRHALDSYNRGAEKLVKP